MARAARVERPPAAHPQLRRLPHGRRLSAARGGVVLHPASPARVHERRRGVLPRSTLLRDLVSAELGALVFLLLVGLSGGWILAGRMLAPLTRITDATRLAAAGSLSHRIRLPGRHDEFRELADGFDGMLERLEAHVAEQRRFAANASTSCAPHWRPRRRCSTWPAPTRTTTPSRSSNACTPSTPGRSSSPRRCSCSAVPSSGRSPGRRSTCHCWRRRRPSRCSPSRRGAASPSRPPVTSRPRSDRSPSCCS